MLEIHAPAVVAPDEVAEPEETDIMEVESAQDIRTSDLAERVLVRRATCRRLDEERVITIGRAVSEARPSLALSVSLLLEVAIPTGRLEPI